MIGIFSLKAKAISDNVPKLPPIAIIASHELATINQAFVLNGFVLLCDIR